MMGKLVTCPKPHIARDVLELPGSSQVGLGVVGSITLDAPFLSLFARQVSASLPPGWQLFSSRPPPPTVNDELPFGKRIGVAFSNAQW